MGDRFDIFGAVVLQSEAVGKFSRLLPRLIPEWSVERIEIAMYAPVKLFVAISQLRCSGIFSILSAIKTASNSIRVASFSWVVRLVRRSGRVDSEAFAPGAAVDSS